jgi:hypothetical protein
MTSPRWFSSWFLILICSLGATLFFTANAFKDGFPYTHDGKSHLVRFANYRIAVREGQFPPRFAPNLWSGFGYPVFNYNYPLANLLSLPFSFAHVHYETTFTILVIISLTFGLIGVTKWLEALNYPPKWWLVGGLTWLASNYLVTSIYFRGTIGEIMAYSLLPWLMWSLEMIRKRTPLRIGHEILMILVWTMFLLSHNIAVVFAIPLFVIVGIFLLGTRWRAWKVLLRIVAFSVIFSLWFWLPALAEIDEVIVFYAENNKSYQLHFPELKQLITSPLSFGYSYAGGVDNLSLGIGLWYVLVLLTSVATSPIFIFSKISRQLKLRFWFYFAMSFLVIFLQLPQSIFIWDFLPYVHFIQFPWRLALFLSVFLVPLSILSFKAISNPLRGLIVVCGIVIFWRLAMTTPAQTIGYDRVIYQTNPESTTTQHENLPRTFTYIDFADDDLPTAINGKATIEVLTWSGSKREYLVITDETVTIVEPTMHFLGWQTWIESNKTGKTRVEYLFTDETQGRIAYNLEAGSYRVRSAFTQQTPARMISHSALILGLITFLYYYRHAFKDV